MLAETAEDIAAWSGQGFLGVEMEASTVFAVSNHFGVPSAAVLSIADNLIEEQTVLHENYEDTRAEREAVRDLQFRAALHQLAK
jgi:uridine phosphorylase